MAKKYLDDNGLLYFWQKITNKFVAKETGKGLSTNDYTTAEKTKLSGVASGAEVNVIENIEVNGVTGTVSGKTASVTIQAGAIDTISVNGTAQTIDANKNVDITVPTKVSDITNDTGFITGINSSDVTTALGFTPYNATNPDGFQTSAQVDAAIDAKIGSTYKAKGSVAFASLPAASSSTEGFVYNITDSFTTTADFVEGAGNTYPAGTNVVIINTTGSTYKYDVLAGFVDLSAYQLSADLVAITNAEIDTIVAS